MEIIATIAGVILVLVLSADCTTKKDGYKKGDLRISRNADGTYYVYEKKTGLALFTGTKKECAEKIEDLLNS